MCVPSTADASARGGVQLEERLLERPWPVPADDDGVCDSRACFDIAALVAVPEVRREPGDRWIR